MLRPLLRPRLAAVLLGAALTHGCGPPQPQPAAGCASVSQAEAVLAAPGIEATAGVSRDNLRRWIATLADPALAGRHAASPGARATAALLARHFNAFGLAAPFPGGDYCQPFPLWETTEQNVIAYLPAAHGGAAPVVVVGAHYDGQGERPAGGVYPGADDNASGVAALLEAARVAAQGPRPENVDWLFVAFGAEEVGLLGARAFLAAPPVERQRLALVVNLDMVGRPLPSDPADAVGFEAPGDGNAAAAALLARAAAAAGVAVRDLADLGELVPTLTDDDAFRPAVATLLLSTGLHGDYHQLGDVPERVDLDQVTRAAELVLALVRQLSPRDLAAL